MLVLNRGTRGSPGSVSLVTQGDRAGSCRVKVAPSSPVPRHWVLSPHSAASRQGRTHGGEASLGLCCIFSFEDESPAALPVAFAMTEEQNPARNSGRPSSSSLLSQSLFLSYLPEVFPSCPGVSVLTPSPRGQIVGWQTLTGQGLTTAGARSLHGWPGALGMSHPRQASVVSRLRRGRAARSWL